MFSAAVCTFQVSSLQRHFTLDLRCQNVLALAHENRSGSGDAEVVSRNYRWSALSKTFPVQISSSVVHEWEKLNYCVV